MANIPFDFLNLASLQLWQKQDDDDGDRMERLSHNLAYIMKTELTPRQKETLELFFFQRLRVTDIARQQGISKAAVSRTLQRSLNKLYRYLRFTY